MLMLVVVMTEVVVEVFQLPLNKILCKRPHCNNDN